MTRETARTRARALVRIKRTGKALLKALPAIGRAFSRDARRPSRKNAKRTASEVKALRHQVARLEDMVHKRDASIAAANTAAGRQKDVISGLREDVARLSAELKKIRSGTRKQGGRPA